MTAVCGLLPAVGDDVTLMRTAAIAFADQTVRMCVRSVEATQDSPGYVWLAGYPYQADGTLADAPKRHLVRVAGLIIHRDT